MKKIQLKNKTINNLVGWGFALPAMLGFLVFNLVPMLMSGYYSLCNYTLLGKPEFIGVKNFIALLSGKNGAFWVSARATVLYAIMAVPANLAFAFFIAVLFGIPFPFFHLFTVENATESSSANSIWVRKAFLLIVRISVDIFIEQPSF